MVGGSPNPGVPVAKANVAQVSLLTGMSRGTKAGYAGLITGGVLGGVYLVACLTSPCHSDEMAAKAAIAALWATIAAGIAALFPRHEEVIYRTLGGTPADGTARKLRSLSLTPPHPGGGGAREQGVEVLAGRSTRWSRRSTSGARGRVPHTSTVFSIPHRV